MQGFGQYGKQRGRAALQPTEPGMHWERRPAHCSNPTIRGVSLQNHLQEFGHKEFSGKRLDMLRLKRSQDLTEHV